MLGEDWEEKLSVKQLKNKEIFEEIQRKRMLMIETAREKGLTNDETIRHSQELDRLIYEYQCLFGSTVHRKKAVPALCLQRVDCFFGRRAVLLSKI